MELQLTKRVINYKGNELADLNPSLPIGDVVKQYAHLHPELATAVVTGPTLVAGKQVYGIEGRVGTKG